MRNWTTIKEFEEIKFEYFEGIAKITINRPRYRNAFTPDTIKEIIDLLIFPEILNQFDIRPESL